MKKKLVCGLAFAALCGAAAADIYRWVDEQGRLQMSDRPPPQHRGTVTKQDSRPVAPSPQQQRDAQDRAARDRDRLKAIEGQRSASQAARATAAASAQADEPVQLPPRASTEDCRLWRIEYSNSLRCYDRFRTKNGVKAEAYGVCGPEVLNPAFECGATRYP